MLPEHHALQSSRAAGVWNPVCLPLQEEKATLLCCVLQPFAKEEMLLSLIYASAHLSGTAAASVMGRVLRDTGGPAWASPGLRASEAGKRLLRKAVSSSLELSVAISRDRCRLLGTTGE